MGVFIDALNNADSEYITAVEQIKDVIGQRLRNPLYWYESMFSKTPTGRKTNALIDKTHEFTHKVIILQSALLIIAMLEPGMTLPTPNPFQLGVEIAYISICFCLTWFPHCFNYIL